MSVLAAGGKKKVRTEQTLSSVSIIYYKNKNTSSHAPLLHTRSLGAHTNTRAQAHVQNNAGGQVGHSDVKPSRFARVSRKSSIT